MSRSLCLRGARIVDPRLRRDEVADLLIHDGIVVDRLPPGAAALVLDLRGLVAVPGLIDLHVHFREPGGEESETIATGSMAAARGGFTRVVTMPNTTPAVDSPEAVRRQQSGAAAAGRVDVLPSAAVTRGRRGESLADLGALATAGAVAFTDDGSTVPGPPLLDDALRTCAGLGRPLMDHAQDPARSRDGCLHEGRRARSLGLPGIPSAAEADVVRRDVEASARTGGHIHLQHLSCAESVAVVRDAVARGLPVSAEVTPHHLALCEDDIPGDDAAFKMSPPLRTAQDRDALAAAVAEGTIKALATDHAPHCENAKRGGFRTGANGIVGLETAVGVTFGALVTAGRVDLATWVSRWTLGPAEVLGLAPPCLAVGQPADVAILDLRTAWTVRAADFASRSRNTPFEGRRLVGRAVCTLLRGRITWLDTSRVPQRTPAVLPLS